MAIVKQHNKKTGVTYVYESHSYRDKQTKQPRSKRKLLGRLDEATGEIVPTRKQSRNITTNPDVKVDTITDSPDEHAAVSLDMVREKDALIMKQQKEILRLHKEMESLSAELEKLASKLKHPRLMNAMQHDCIVEEN